MLLMMMDLDVDDGGNVNDVFSRLELARSDDVGNVVWFQFGLVSLSMLALFYLDNLEYLTYVLVPEFCARFVTLMVLTGCSV